jgi:integrase
MSGSMSRRRMKGSGSLRLRSNIWWITYYVGGRPIAESSHSSIKEVASNLLAQRLGELAAGEDIVSPKKVTISDLCELVFADYRLRNLRDLKNVKWRYEANIKPVIGSLLASKFGKAQVRAYVEARRAHADDATINRELAIIRRGFHLGLEEDPPLVRRVPKIVKLEEDNVRQGFIEQAQYLVLRAAMPDHLKCPLVVGYHVGNRLGELRKIEWTQINLEAGEIRIEKRQAKGKKPRTLPIYGDMHEWLEWQWQRRVPGCDLVFHYKGKPLGSHLKGWARACDQAGLPGLHFHDLRRSAIRNMERAGISRHVAMAISGHKTEAVYRRYDIVVDQDLKTATEKLEQYQRSQQQPKLKLVK